jgi:hypothetical protein
LVVVEPLLTVRLCAELADVACPDPLAPVNVAVSDSGEPPAANDAVHVAVALDPLTVTGRLVQPEIGVPFAENATVPAGAMVLLVFVATVAVRVTFWLVLADDGPGVASVVVVGVVPLTTVAVTLLDV